MTILNSLISLFSNSNSDILNSISNISGGSNNQSNINYSNSIYNSRIGQTSNHITKNTLYFY
ncbi:hypothetical protein PPL_12228 [Heterostelium album PN500]|uniref:Uncharacterized protein n=1 Tax=Heterostelium pallidum (strain ATCC 26659 / Pp 5 / PN500) TaxID=670386 RepID=D3BM20_HETP5|nr:hypothetical protein PPL_12228 [Heterostelium album PN500]EFA77621.1 hypothetical protein PPL_12228 [Heterostelium album PN500]|eukprot:XP_020429749.1 hypothetical protein PPL_12228 [Heterostelium album PN500]